MDTIRNLIAFVQFIVVLVYKVTLMDILGLSVNVHTQ